MKPIRSILLGGFLAVVVCLAVVYTSCKRDHCNNVVCQNGGACDGGNCICLIGFEGSNCQTQSINKFISKFNGGDTCSNHDSVFTQYAIQFTTEFNNPTEMNMQGILNNKFDSALCTMWATDSFTFQGSNNATTYTGTGTLHLDTLRIIYHVQQDTTSFDCEYVGAKGTL